MAIRVFHSAVEWAGAISGRSILTIGNFDGIHRGHQAILQAVTRESRACGTCASGAITFEPHPVKFLRPAEAPLLLSTLHARVIAFQTYGLDAALVLPFNEHLARVTPEEFVRKFLVEKLRTQKILVGANFRFGHRHAGDVALLETLGRQLGYEVLIVPPVTFRGQVVSSSAVRQAAGDGNMARAAQMLGHPLCLTGRIIAGEGRGRQLGFPTLNMAWQQELLPPPGVYVTSTLLEKVWMESVTNVGYRPTFGGSAMSVESHVLSTDYGAITATSGPIEVGFFRRLREERKFPSPEALREQIQADVNRAKRYWDRYALFQQARA